MVNRSPVLFGMFFISGFAAMVYQIVWLRLAFASFGVVTPVLSVVVSTFMLGLALGSWAAGKWSETLARRARVSAILLYAGTELLIGLGAVGVPAAFAGGAAILRSSGATDSAGYLLLSAAIIVVSLLPWCTLMGATYPTVLAYLREVAPGERNGFSFLYLANVVGAMVGALLTAGVLVELLGFHRTLLVAAAGNVAIFLASCALARQRLPTARQPDATTRHEPESAVPAGERRWLRGLLFTTGAVSLAFEVVWTRAFTPVLQTTIYAFAAILSVYLLATWVGSAVYRAHLRARRALSWRAIAGWLSLASLLPLIGSDPRRGLGAVALVLTIFPCCAVLGYLTPGIIDSLSAGDPESAGRAYAINILGCILGPLLAGYLLLPLLGDRLSLVVLVVPLLIFCLPGSVGARSDARAALVPAGLAVAGLAWAAGAGESYEDAWRRQGAEVRRDYTATVIAYGAGMRKQMLVNGVGITSLTPITKVMAHLTLASLSAPPHSALTICFGMGTTFRSLMSWGIDVTAVELVPSVVQSFPYYAPDARQLLQAPNAHVLIDDGRRFLDRTQRTFDAIIIDPPPPVEAAGSSLLYSEEFYRAARRRLATGGILQQWFPGFGDPTTLDAALRSVLQSFPYVTVYRSVENWGYHILASDRPIATPTVETMLARMPQRAQADLMEWFPHATVHEEAARILQGEVAPEGLLLNGQPVAITDDRPFNEYFLARRWLAGRV